MEAVKIEVKNAVNAIFQLSPAYFTAISKNHKHGLNNFTVTLNRKSWQLLHFCGP
jgi:hypothetical protein